MSIDDPNKLTIEYRAGSDDLPKRMGCFVALGVVVSSIIVYVVLVAWAAASGWKVPVVVTTVSAVGFGALWLWSYRRYRWRGLALGLLIGLGAGALLEGMCFAAISR